MARYERGLLMGARCDSESDGPWLVNCTACLHHLLLGLSHSAANLAVPMGLGWFRVWSGTKVARLRDGVGVQKDSSSRETQSFGCLTQHL